ncbi:MAG: hypothetical protein ABL894_07555 [Hyphomicrobium sp.]
MSKISDEMLMAYSDGELSFTDRLRVEAYVARDPSGALRLAAFTATGKELSGLFDRPMREPVPQRLIDAVMGSTAQSTVTFPAPAAAVASAQIIQFDHARRIPARTLPKWGLAAACVTLLASAIGTQWLFSSRTSGTGDDFGVTMLSDGVRVPSQALASVLDTTASGQSVANQISGMQVTIKPVFTFASEGQGHCRQYEIKLAQPTQLTGVACRTSGGPWHIEGQVASAFVKSTDGSIVPAGKSSSASIDALVDRMIAGDVMGIEEEAGLMERGWR